MAKITKMFSSFINKHETFIRKDMTKTYTNSREEFISKFPDVKNSWDLQYRLWVEMFPDSEEVLSHKDTTEILKSFSLSNKKMEMRKLSPTMVAKFESQTDFYNSFGKTIYNDNEFSTKLEEMIVDIQETNRGKLLNALNARLDGLDIASVKEVKSVISEQGIEGEFTLTLESGTVGGFRAKSIYAGGFNIQCLHYRYLMRLDKHLEAEKNVEDPIPEHLIGLKKMIHAFVKTSEDSEMQLPGEIIKHVETLKGQSRNFTWFVRRNYLDKQEYGGSYLGTYKYHVTEKGKEFFA
jgi:hypothetical protein